MNDKFTPVTPEIYAYLEPLRSDASDTLLNELRAETAALGEISGMQIAAEQGTFLQILAAGTQAKQALEIGTFTGYSALCIARGLAPPSRLTCLDKSGEWTNVARRYWERAGVAEKIELRLGDARETLVSLVNENRAPFDFVFIDADKPGYDFYYETVLPHCAPGALLVIDNMLRGGRLAASPDTWDEDDHALAALNHKLARDTRVTSALLPVADGLNICLKL
jgi:caffeoyl-CoA O-methyltransferase